MNDQNIEKIDSTKPIKKHSFKRKILFTLLTAVIIVTGIASISYAQKMKHLRDNGPMFFMIEKVTKDLNLTNDQKTQLQSLKDEIKTKMQARKENRKNDIQDFENAFKQDKLDKEYLLTLDKKHETDRQEMKEFMFDELVKFHDILTPEQRSKAVDKIRELKENHDSWKHKDKGPKNN